MSTKVEKALIAGATSLLPIEQEYLRQYPDRYMDTMRNTILEVLEILRSQCTLVEYRHKGKKWVQVTPVKALTLTGKNFTRFQSEITPGGMYALVKARLGK
jgi:hypothetical protein